MEEGPQTDPPMMHCVERHHKHHVTLPHVSRQVLKSLFKRKGFCVFCLFLTIIISPDPLMYTDACHHVTYTSHACSEWSKNDGGRTCFSFFYRGYDEQRFFLNGKDHTALTVTGVSDENGGISYTAVRQTTDVLSARNKQQGQGSMYRRPQVALPLAHMSTVQQVTVRVKMVP